MRLLPLCVLLVVSGCLLFPFLLTAWLREHRGVDITGKVAGKQETVWHSAFENDITRSATVTVSYFPPDRSWAANKTVHLPLKRYDEISRGDVLRVRYLLERDLPNYPLLHSLYRSGFLPVASVDGRSIFSIWRDLLAELPLRLIETVAALILALWLWYKFRMPGHVFAVVICIFGALAAICLSEIPRPMSPLQGAVDTAGATVQSQWIVDRVFGGRNSMPWNLNQPVQYVAFELLPEGRREPVVAADNIDAGSIPNLQVGQSVTVQYERANPRNARLASGTRVFWNQNLRGLAVAAAVWVVLGGLAVAIWERLYRRRPGSARI